MKIEKQVCNLKLAKSLKELGAKQDSLFYWYPKPKVIHNSGGVVECNGYKILFGDKARIYGVNAKYSAFTAAELGEILPEKYLSVQMENNFAWECSHIDITEYAEFANTEANARAKMLIYLIENNLTKQEETR